jgi:hypothetical protein
MCRVFLEKDKIYQNIVEKAFFTVFFLIWGFVSKHS